LIKTLKQEMEEAADNLDYELAAVLRDKLVELNALPKYSKKETAKV
ncbi:MAG TPA: hypothetical protein DHV62_05060, partial [Elusimicrobia bacterium]|nr:hypothetical protein [Elusimicrobiota bacterium]